MKVKIIGFLLVFIGGMLSMVYGGQLTSVTALPNNSGAGVSTFYSFGFRTSASGSIPVDGKIFIIFPNGFDLSTAEIAQSTTTGVLNGGLSASVSGDTIKILRDGTGTTVAADIQVGLKVALIGNHQTAATTYNVNVETRLSDNTFIDSGTSSNFSIIHGNLAAFSFDPITDQTAGSTFNVTITARDLFGNQVDTFAGTASLSDLTATLTPTLTTNFISGSWTGTVQINRSFSNNEISATSQNVSGKCNTFNVNPAALHHFSFQNISSPQTAGQPFGITITAQDQFDNPITSFTGPVTLSDSTESINPTVTGAFVNGVYSGNVSIIKKQNNVAIIAISGLISDFSNLFNVKSAALKEFSIATVLTQTAGIPFSLEVTVLDQYGNQVESFNETVDLSDLTGTIDPTVSSAFVEGYWSGNVTIDQVRTNNVITVTRTSTQIETGSSNSFNVSSGGLDHFSFNSIASPQIAGNSFGITITALDDVGNTVTSFTGTASLSELTNSIDPAVIGNFVAGVWSGTVKIRSAQAANRITAISGNKNGTSNNFDVNPGAVSHFQFNPISSPQTAGVKFSITVKAIDGFGNPVTSFSNTINLNDATGTINRSSITLTNGVGTLNDVRISKAQNDITISANWNTISDVSNSFNVTHNALDRFLISTIGTQAAGAPFTITVTAQDYYNNRVLNFAGTVDIADLTGTIDPEVSDNFENGQWSGSVTIDQVFSNNRITVTRTGGSAFGNSNLFNVIAGNIDHFEISNITGLKTAGTPFSITVTAKDASGGTVTGFTGTANLVDLTGKILPTTTTNFASGVWTGNVTVTQKMNNDIITVTGVGKSGSSNQFNVQAAALHHFTLQNITSPQTAGQNIPLTVMAKDCYENTIDSFTATADLSDDTGTIDLAVTGNFVAGVWSGSVVITKAQNDVEITAQQGSISGSTNSFNIEAATLNNFLVNTISTQTANVPFSISLVARDAFDNRCFQYSGKVVISDLSGYITPTESQNFSNGALIENVTISRSYSNNRITVTNQGGSETVWSNTFNVSSGEVDHFTILTIGNQIAGQNFSITIRAEDVSNNIVTSFAGSVSLSNLTNSITPTSSGNFNNGQWTGTVQIIKTQTSDIIAARYGSKAGTSNTFNVNPGVLDHFEFDTINSPQTAGNFFTITIRAKDSYENVVLNYTSPINLSDSTNTITPVATGNFVSGVWTNTVRIIKSQQDVRILASGNSKTGYSNFFNVKAANLHHFAIENITTQSAGVPFILSVTAEDFHQNQVTTFVGTVNIADLTGSVSPQTSGNFVNGVWAGNVTVALAASANKITVTRTGGSERNKSNSFDVITGGVSEFQIANIPASQIAGVPFNITITAKDATGNTVVNFISSVALTDLTGALQPATTSNFVSGVWTGAVKITKTKTANKIFASAGGKSGESNSFNVLPGALDHFSIGNISSPQVAGQPITITITAKDSMNNTATNYGFNANLSDNTNTLSPTSTPVFSNGSWIGTVSISKKMDNVYIRATRLDKSGQSNFFNVRAAALSYLKIMDLAGGVGSEIGVLSMGMDEQKALYAAGFDIFHNYSRDVAANWGVTGNLDLPAPTVGRFTNFSPTTPETVGKIWADTAGVTPDSTGLVNVGTLSYVKILTDSQGKENYELNDYTMTADETLTLYSAGYDSRGNFIGNHAVQWSSTGTLVPAVSANNTMINFEPTTAAAAGTIIADHLTAQDDITGIITVLPGVPVGAIALIPEPSVLPADGMSLSTIKSDIIHDAEGNSVAFYTQFTVTANIGTITSVDINPIVPGKQIAANDSGKIEFIFQAAGFGGTAFINVSSVNGSAAGSTEIFMGSIRIEEISSVHQNISQGQTGVQVSMLVQNLGPNEINTLTAGLIFTGPPPDDENRNGDYLNVHRIDAITAVPSLGQANLLFSADVTPNAKTGILFVDGWISGQIGSTAVSDTFAERRNQLIVQTPADLKITKIYSDRELISRGDTGINLKMEVVNNGEAGANVVNTALRFWSLDSSNDVTIDYEIFPSAGNPPAVSGDSSTVQFDYIVNVKPAADLGRIEINGSIQGTDANKGTTLVDNNADTTHTWVVQSAPLVRIIDFYPSDTLFTKNQTEDWTLTMVLENKGQAKVRLVQDNILFLLKGVDITSQYNIIDTNGIFSISGDDTLRGNSIDTLHYVIGRTGSSVGDITIKGLVTFEDASAKTIEDERSTGISVLDYAKLTISKMLASQNEVTKNQNQNWSVKVVVKNEGGTDIAVDNLATQSYINFYPAANFTVIQPAAFSDGDLILDSGAADTLTFTVDRTVSSTGNYKIFSKVTGHQTTNQETVIGFSRDSISVLVEEPAKLQIVSLRSLAPNNQLLNTDQQFGLEVQLKNNGQDKVKNATMTLSASGSSQITNPSVVFYNISGTTMKRDTFFVAAAHLPSALERFSVRTVNALAENTNESSGVLAQVALDSTESVIIQQPALLRITSITTPDTITASQIEPWEINVLARNAGGADLYIEKHTDSNIAIRVEDSVRIDYKIDPPIELKDNGFHLAGGNSQAFVYTVTNTGKDAGNALLLFNLSAIDQNNLASLNAQKSDNFYIKSTAAVQLVKTEPICLNFDAQNDKGYVNRGQQFLVRVWVKNLGRKRIKDVEVFLQINDNNSNSLIINNKKTIGIIDHDVVDSVDFEITADPTVPRLNEVFTSAILSAKEYDTNLPALVDNSGDNLARVRIQDPANLKLEANSERNITAFTINQVFRLEAAVNNIGADPSPVDSSGTLLIEVPQDYRIIVNEDTLENNHVLNFTAAKDTFWSIYTPEYASGPDTIYVSLQTIPMDLNINSPAQVLTDRDTIIVNTEATNMIISTYVSNPPGAQDRTLSTQQEFVVVSNIQYSPNLSNVRATLTLPDFAPYYYFQSPADSAQNVTSLEPVFWRLRAPNESVNYRKIYVTIRGDEQGNPLLLVRKDSIEVKTVLRAELDLNAWISYPEGAQDGKVTSGQKFEVKAEVNNNGTAHVLPYDTLAHGYLKISLGSTGCQLVDTTETLIKPFNIDTAVIWKLKAPFAPTTEANIIINYFENKIPLDENTNTNAYYHPNNNKVNIPITTEEGGYVGLTAGIQDPPGARNGIVSTEQGIYISADVTAFSVNNVVSQLILPDIAPSIFFEFDSAFAQIQSGESPLWRINAPDQPVSAAQLKIISWGTDTNNDTVRVYSDTARINISIVQKGKIRIVAQISSPIEATDQIVSIDQEFRIQAYLINLGQAGFDGQYQFRLTLPDGYSTTDALTSVLTGDAIAEWKIKAPGYEKTAANIEILVPSGNGPRDENSGSEMEFEDGNRSVNIPITTYQKTVQLSKVVNSAPTTVVNGQQNVPLLSLRFFNPKPDNFSNSVILSGFQILLKDRTGILVNDPAQVISRIAVCKYSDNETIYGAVNDFSSGSMVTIMFAQPDTIHPDQADSINIVVDIASAPQLQDLRLFIPSDTSIFIGEALTFNRPVIELENSSGNFEIESDFIVILGNNLKESFGNYPNPFGAKGQRPVTTITYYLKEDTDVQIKIYTLIGELVWSRSFTANDPEGRKGTHAGDVTWDARNDQRNKVLNGIYVIYIKTGFGESATTKAAVIK